MPKKLNHAIGDVFEISPDGKVKFQCAIVGMDGKGCAVGVFFHCGDGEPLFYENHLMIIQFGDLHIIDGAWRRSGRISEEIAEAWFPSYFYRENMFGQKFVTRYDRQLNLISEDLVSEEETLGGLPSDDLFGAGAVEQKLMNAIA